MPAVRYRVLGVPLEIRASFLVLAVVLGLQRHTDSLLITWVVIATIAVLVHEAGHAAAFRAFGIAPSVILHGGGGVTFGGDPGIHRRITLTIAGPVAGVLLGVVAVALARALPASPTAQALVDDLFFATIGWSLLNLLPVGDMDGHAVMKDLVRVALGHPAVFEIRVIGVAIVVALVCGAVLLGQYEGAFIIGFVAVMSSTSFDRAIKLPALSGGGTPAVELLVKGRNGEALAATEAALRRNPADADALYERATILRLMTRYDESEAAFTQLLTLQPGLPRALSGRAMVRSALGKEKDARADVDALAIAPTSGPNDALAGVIALYVSERYEEAHGLIEAALARPDLPRAERGQLSGMQALVNEALGRPDVALRQVDAVLADHPDDHVLHEVRALVLIGLARPEEAVKSARRALDVAPRNPELLETMGIVERFAGRAEAGLPRLLAAAVERPELPRARAELSACFTQLGRLDEARGALETLPETAQRDPFVMYAQACLIGAAGDRVEAADRLATAARIRPGLGRRAAADPVLGWMFEDSNAADTTAAWSTQAVGGSAPRIVP